MQTLRVKELLQKSGDCALMGEGEVVCLGPDGLTFRIGVEWHTQTFYKKLTYLSPNSRWVNGRMFGIRVR